MERMKNKTIQDSEDAKKKVVSNSGTYAILLTALFAMTFFGVCDPTESVDGPKGNAAKVGPETVTFGQFRRAYQNRSQQ